jgi:hypothetical protein
VKRQQVPLHPLAGRNFSPHFCGRQTNELKRAVGDCFTGIFPSPPARFNGPVLLGNSVLTSHIRVIRGTHSYRFSRTLVLSWVFTFIQLVICTSYLSLFFLLPGTMMLSVPLHWRLCVRAHRLSLPSELTVGGRRSYYYTTTVVGAPVQYTTRQDSGDPDIQQRRWL